MSFPFGVTAAHQVAGVIAWLTKWTLPSPITQLIPTEWPELGRLPLPQPKLLLTQPSGGLIWNMKGPLGPILFPSIGGPIGWEPDSTL